MSVFKIIMFSESEFWVWAHFQSSEETEEFDGYQDSVSAKSNYYTLEGDDDAAAGPSDTKMASAFWDVRNPAARAGKRKISWQDQLALRV